MIPQVRCSKCRFVKYSRNEDQVDGPQGQQQQMRPLDSCDGLLDLPPAQQLRLQQRLHRSRSRSGSPSIDSVRLLQRSCLPVRTTTSKRLDDRIRVDCFRIDNDNCKEFAPKQQKEQQQRGKSTEIEAELKLPADHGDRWGHDLERGRRLDPSTDNKSAERGRSRRSRKDCFKLNEVNNQKTQATPQGFGPAVQAVQTNKNVPTSDDKLRFQRSLNSAATLLFHTTASTGHHHNGLTKAPFGQRFPLKFLRSPPLRMSSSPLLGSFEVYFMLHFIRTFRPCLTLIFVSHPQECLLNGRLEPMSTVEGFRAELGASGSFCPSHELLPVSVFFYNFGGLETDKASPYLAHLNLGAKG